MLSLLLSLALAAPVPPEVRQLIDDQLKAFEHRDAERAWKHVAPVLKMQFGTADRFLEMVERGYQPVVAPREVDYGEFVTYEGAPAQWLDLAARDGKSYRALYLLEKQADGTWRTAGCLLFEVEEPKPSA
jgi:hypothetical protein